MSHHAAFAASLLATQPVCAPGLTTWNGSDPARRFAVYRNNVMVSLIDALADTYPVTLALVGEEFFRAMAGIFARSHPPRSPVMAAYGAGFAPFIGDFEPAAGLPYLADLARLEWLRVEAYHAADAVALAPDDFAALMADPERLPEARFELHPSLRVLDSSHGIVSLWAAHQGEDVASRVATVDTCMQESALVLRRALEVDTYCIPAATVAFIRALARNRMGVAAAQAQDADANFDLAAALGLLMRSGAVSGWSQ